MFTRNLGQPDRVLRVIVGIVLIGSGIYLTGTVGIILGVVGLIPLFTGLVGNCPAYTLFHISTCSRKGV